jgi:hypothetical protein
VRELLGSDLAKSQSNPRKPTVIRSGIIQTLKLEPEAGFETIGFYLF